MTRLGARGVVNYNTHAAEAEAVAGECRRAGVRPSTTRRTRLTSERWTAFVSNREEAMIQRIREYALRGLSRRGFLAALLLGLAAGCGPYTSTPNQSPTESTTATGESSAPTEPKTDGGSTSAETGKPPVNVVVETSKGTIEMELYPDKAPVTVENFVKYVKKGQYDGTIFHRVIPDFMIQGGGYTKDMEEKPTDLEIKNEAGNGLKNERGTVAMARKGDPDSASAQWFINVKDNEFLNHKDDSVPGYGYCVFGKVTKGMDVVDAIKSVPTKSLGGGMDDVPVEPVTIKSVKVKE
jgi:cyclophilin family peptidyl-prolyl cis-trans isomerase